MPENIATTIAAAVPDTSGADAETASDIVLELRVRNHPGTLSHVAGLFARRAFNLDAVVCVPEPDPECSRMLLLVRKPASLTQLERQLAKLHDVVALRRRPELGRTAFAALRTL